MEIYISSVKDYSKKEEMIVIRDRGISLIDNSTCYERMLCQDIQLISKVENELAKIMFSWKEEYIGGRLVDGERYRIVVDVNHKKKKYKIQNKFPSNWKEFIELKNKIMEGRLDE